LTIAGFMPSRQGKHFKGLVTDLKMYFGTVA
jgi:hypothetical protein